MQTASIGQGRYLRSDAAARFNEWHDAFRRKFGRDLHITSALRTRAEQQRLYDGWIARRPGFNLAAKPGTSLHEQGRSVDLASPGGVPLTAAHKAWLDATSAEFGFEDTGDGFTPREGWHYDYVGGGQSGTPKISDTIRRVQEKLKTNYPLYARHLAVDGINGPATKAAVKEYQRRAGLTPDGIVGPRTLRSLGLA